MRILLVIIIILGILLFMPLWPCPLCGGSGKLLVTNTGDGKWAIPIKVSDLRIEKGEKIEIGVSEVEDQKGHFGVFANCAHCGGGNRVAGLNVVKYRFNLSFGTHRTCPLQGEWREVEECQITSGDSNSYRISFPGWREK